MVESKYREAVEKAFEDNLRFCKGKNAVRVEKDLFVDYNRILNSAEFSEIKALAVRLETALLASKLFFETDSFVIYCNSEKEVESLKVLISLIDDIKFDTVGKIIKNENTYYPCHIMLEPVTDAPVLFRELYVDMLKTEKLVITPNLELGTFYTVKLLTVIKKYFLNDLAKEVSDEELLDGFRNHRMNADILGLWVLDSCYISWGNFCEDYSSTLGEMVVSGNVENNEMTLSVDVRELENFFITVRELAKGKDFDFRFAFDYTEVFTSLDALHHDFMYMSRIARVNLMCTLAMLGEKEVPYYKDIKKSGYDEEVFKQLETEGNNKFNIRVMKYLLINEEEEDDD